MQTELQNLWMLLACLSLRKFAFQPQKKEARIVLESIGLELSLKNSYYSRFPASPILLIGVTNSMRQIKFRQLLFL